MDGYLPIHAFNTTMMRPSMAEPAPPAGRWLSIVTHLDPRYGGLSAVVPQLSSAIAATGQFHMALAAFCSPGELYSASNHAELTLTEWPASRGAWLRDGALRQTFFDLLHDRDGLHIHGLWEQSTLIGVRAARARRLPYVLSAHGMLERWAMKNKRLKKLVYSKLIEHANVDGAACLHALTLAEAEDYRRFGCKGPIAIIPNGVRLPERIDSQLFLTQNPSLKEKRIVLFLGRIHFKKGLDLLIQAWKKIILRWPEAHLVLAGPDFEGTRARVTDQIQSLDLTSHVLFTGMLRDELKWSALAAAECFVLPSYSEGLSVSALEAMGVGLPVILSEHCNLPEVAALGAGWVVPAETTELQCALGEMLENSPLQNREIGAHGRSFVRQRYSWSTIAQQMSEVYGWVQGGNRPTSIELLEPGEGR